MLVIPLLGLLQPREIELKFGGIILVFVVLKQFIVPIEVWLLRLIILDPMNHELSVSEIIYYKSGDRKIQLRQGAIAFQKINVPKSIGGVAGVHEGT